MSDSEQAVLAVMLEGTWHAKPDIAEACGLSARMVTYGLNRLVSDGLVEQDADDRTLYRRRPRDGGAVVVASAPAEADVPAPPASFAVWDDGGMTITRAQESMFLSPDDVQRLRVHLHRIIW